MSRLRYHLDTLQKVSHHREFIQLRGIHSLPHILSPSSPHPKLANLAGSLPVSTPDQHLVTTFVSNEG